MSLPIRARLTAWYGSLLGATLLALGAFLVYFLQEDLQEHLDDEVDHAVVELRNALEDEVGDGEDSTDAEDSHPSEDFVDAAAGVLPPKGAEAQLLDASGRILVVHGDVGHEGALADGAETTATLDGQPLRVTRTFDGQAHRVHAAAVPGGSGDRVVVVAESMEPIEQVVGDLVRLLLLAGPLAVLVTGLGGYWLAARALRPVDRMTQDAAEIGFDRLADRIEVPDSEDETQRLARTLNAMLQRIEEGARRKQRGAANASHELRTPLAVMRSEIDVALRSGRCSETEENVLLSLREEVDRLTRIVENMVVLAQADEGRLELLTSPVEVDDLLHGVVSRLQPFAHANHVALRVEGDGWRGQVDGPRLALVVTNLVENAVKYARPGGGVRVRSWRTPEHLCLSVSDDGPPIDARDRSQLFERFYRTEDARAGDVPGGGLGLAICEEVVDAHGGRIDVDDQVVDRNVFRVFLPVWRAVEAQGAGSSGGRMVREGGGSSERGSGDPRRRLAGQ